MVVLSGDAEAAVPAVFEVAGGTRRRIRGNLARAFLYNAVAILGAPNPLFAAVAMGSSSLLVVANSARSVGPSGGAETPVPVEPAEPHEATGASVS